MKETKFLFLIFLIPVAYAFTGESVNYQTIGNLGLDGYLWMPLYTFSRNFFSVTTKTEPAFLIYGLSGVTTN